MLDFEKLSGELGACFERVHAVWEELGLGDEARAEKLSELEARLKGFLEGEITKQRCDYDAQRAEIGAIGDKCAELKERLGEDPAVLRIEMSRTRWKDFGGLREALSAELRRLRGREEQLGKLIADNVAEGQRLTKDLGDSGGLALVSAKTAVSKEFLRRVLAFNRELEARRDRKIEEITRISQNVGKLQTSLGLPPSADAFPDTLSERQSSLSQQLDALVDLYASRKAALQELHCEARELLRRAAALNVPLSAPPPAFGLDDLSPQRLADCREAVRALATELGATLARRAQCAYGAVEALYAELDARPEKRAFAAPPRDATGDVLAELGREEARLRVLQRARASLGSLLARRERILRERASLDDADPLRFRVPGRLLREEKARALVAELPAVAARLQKLARLLEAGTGRPVLVAGERLCEALESFQRGEVGRKEAERAARERRRAGLASEGAEKKAESGAGGEKSRQVFKTPTKKACARAPQSAAGRRAVARLAGAGVKRAKTPDGVRRAGAVFSVPISLK